MRDRSSFEVGVVDHPSQSLPRHIRRRFPNSGSHNVWCSHPAEMVPKPHLLVVFPSKRGGTKRQFRGAAFVPWASCGTRVCSSWSVRFHCRIARLFVAEGGYGSGFREPPAFGALGPPESNCLRLSPNMISRARSSSSRIGTSPERAHSTLGTELPRSFRSPNSCPILVAPVSAPNRTLTGLRALARAAGKPLILAFTEHVRGPAPPAVYDIGE